MDSFWGEAFRDYVLRLSVGSLLAENNVPALTNKKDSRFFFCTTQGDWNAIQNDPTFDLLASYIEPVFIELRRSVPDFIKPIIAEKRRREGLSIPAAPEDWGAITVTPDDLLAPAAYAELERIGRDVGIELNVHHHYAFRIFFMSNGHKAGATRAFEDGACAVFLGADLVMSDGAIPELERIVARNDKKVVLTATLRFAQDECLSLFKERGLMEPGRPFTMPPRDMVATMFRHMHPETACFLFDSPEFCDIATSAAWRVPGDDGILLHNLNYYPLLVNFAGVDHHDAAYFDSGGTIDGRYIALHFDPLKDIEVIDDSDRLMLASFTRKDEYYYPITRTLAKSLPGLRTPFKTHLIRKTLFGPMGDAVKRHYYNLPLKLHSKPLTKEWDKVACRAGRIAHEATQPVGRWDAVLAAYQGLGDWWRLLSLTPAGMRREAANLKGLARCIARAVYHRFLAVLPDGAAQWLRVQVRRVRG